MVYRKISDDEVEEEVVVKRKIGVRDLDEEIRMLENEIASLTARLKELKIKKNDIINTLKVVK